MITPVSVKATGDMIPVGHHFEQRGHNMTRTKLCDFNEFF